MSSVPSPASKARKSLTRISSIHSSMSSDSSIYNLLKPEVQTPQSTTREELVHVAEVHNSKTKLLVSSEDEDRDKKNGRRKKRHKFAGAPSTKKKLREPRKGEETDTLSEIESGGEAVPVIEVVRRVHRAPTKGSATDTLSDASDSALRPEKSLLVPHFRKKTHRAPRRGSVTDTLSEESDAPEKAGLLAPTQPVVTSPVSDSNLEKPKPVSRIPRPSTAHIVRRKSPRQEVEESIPVALLKDISADECNSIPANASPYHKTEGNVGQSSSPESRGKTVGTPVPAPRHIRGQSFVTPEKISSLSAEETDLKPVLQRLKHKKKKMSSSQFSEEPLSSQLTDSEKGEHSPYGNELVAVTVHGCDPLKFLDFARSPFVRLHVMDSVTGEKLTKENSSLQTKPFHLKINRTVTPCWEEDLLIGEPSRIIISKRTVLLFEIIDLRRRERVIAWAFLKLIASNGADNLARMLRLQLFKPLSRLKVTSGKLPCFVWWSKGKYSVYSSTLYISVNPVPVPEIDTTLANGSDVITEDSRASREIASEEKRESLSEEEEIVWTRLGGQSCKLPTAQAGGLECGRDGALCLAFSHSGRSLATPTKGAVLIYGIPSLRLRLSLYNHSGVVHDLSWSPSDEYLLTASADSTACIWAVAKKQTTPFKVLSHPTYVYSCCWVSNTWAVTGCLDGHIRLWGVSGNDLPRFLTKHRSRVNTVASAVPQLSPNSEYVDSDSEEAEKWILISGDSSGVIILWREDPESEEFNLDKEIAVRELSGQIINKIIIVPGGKRFLVQSRDSLIRMIDIATCAVLQYYQGGVCVKTQGSMALCGCSRRVWSWSEEGCIMVWDLASGAQLAIYSELHGAIALHPLDHMAAVVPHRPDTRPEMIVFVYDRSKDGQELGLVVLDRRSAKRDNWSARSIPLQPIPAVRIQPPPGLRFSKESRTPSPRPGTVSPMPQVKMTRAFSGEIKPKPREKKEVISPAKATQLEVKNSTPRPQDRDSRLSEIIDKMDTILLQASPKQAACV